jgi:hypothetical protein
MEGTRGCDEELIVVVYLVVGETVVTNDCFVVVMVSLTVVLSVRGVLLSSQGRDMESTDRFSFL